METITKSKTSKLYARLFAFCNRQYKDVKDIRKAYQDAKGNIFHIEYITTSGIISIPKDTADAVKIITFK